MTSMCFIYGLIDPRLDHAGELRYVGQSHVGMKRPLDVHGAKCGNWQKCLRKLDLREEIFIIEEWDGYNDWKIWLNETETFYITYFRMIGCNLKNMTDGGEGLKNPTVEVRRKIAQGRFKRMGKHLEQRKQAVSAGVKQYWDSEQSIRQRQILCQTRPRPVTCLTNNTNYASIQDAANILNVSISTVNRCCKDGKKRRGFQFVIRSK
jgi:hypothetical protein